MPQTNQDFRGRLLPNTIGTIWDSLYPLGDRPASTLWKVPKAQQYGSTFPFYARYPRPTGEVNSFSSHLWAHSQIDYELDLEAEFGCFPYKWTITSGPVGATIVSEYTRSTVGGLTLHSRPANYGRLIWPGVKSGSANFVVECRDQLDNVITYTFTVTVDDTKFVFLDAAAANDSGDGSYASPKKTFPAVWVAGFAQRTIVIKNGTYSASETGNTSSILFNNTTRPTAIINYPGHTPSLNLLYPFRDGGDNNSSDDLLMRGIRIVNATLVPDGNNKMIHFARVQSRNTFQHLTFANVTKGTVGDDNPGCIVYFDAGGRHYNISVSNCVLEASCTVQLVVFFRVDHFGASFNTADGVTLDSALSNGDVFINAKDGSNYVDFIGNYFNGTNASRTPIAFFNQSGSVGATYQRSSYNRIKNSAGGCEVWHLSNYDPDRGPCESFANTFIAVGDSAYGAGNWAPRPGMKSQSNLWAGSYLAGILGSSNTTWMDLTGVPNQQITPSDVDSSLNLTGSAVQYRLTKGAELFS